MDFVRAVNTLSPSPKEEDQMARSAIKIQPNDSIAVVMEHIMEIQDCYLLRK